MIAQRQTGTFHVIQYLRALAALAVVFLHTAGEVFGQPAFLGSTGIARLGASGVDLFFVISGFIIFSTMTPGRGVAEATRFMWNRIVRVMPLYWLWTTIVVGGILTGLMFHNFWLDLPTAITSYLLIPYEIVPGKYYPILTPAWTLSFEMYFYALTAVAIALLPRHLRLPALAAMLAAVQLAAPLIPGSEAIRLWLGSPLVYEFLAGACIAAAFRADRLRGRIGAHPALGLGLMGLGLCGLAATIPSQDPAAWRVLVWGIPSVLIVAGAVLAERPSLSLATRALSWLGAASYSVYLVHHPVTAFLGAAVKRGLLQAVDPDLLVVLATVATVAVGAATYPLVERPLLARLRRRNPAHAHDARQAPSPSPA